MVRETPAQDPAYRPAHLSAGRIVYITEHGERVAAIVPAAISEFITRRWG